MIKLTASVLGYPITVTAMPAGNDWNIIILGGCTPHVGSVSLAEYENGTVTLRTLLRDTHKDHIIGNRFAQLLSEQEHCTVSVSCGIHYNELIPDDLNKIVACTDQLLSELSLNISQK